MVVQHNMSAMNANRMLSGVSSAQSKSTEKLSSGYRINRAADDAAGLSISEKMRGLYGQCGSKRNESTGTGFALLPGVGHRLPDRDALEWLADRPFP